MKKIGVLSFLSVMLFVAQAHAAIIFDNSSRQNFNTARSGSSPLAAITVGTPTQINQIGAMVDLSANGNLEFLIFNLDTKALLFKSASYAYTDDGLTYKLSPVFSNFQLDPGITYGIGAIADVDGLWGASTNSSGNPFTQNGITASGDRNGNVLNFSSPTLSKDDSAMIIVELGGTMAVPEPASLALLGLGVVGVVGLRKFKR